MDEELMRIDWRTFWELNGATLSVMEHQDEGWRCLVLTKDHEDEGGGKEGVKGE